MTQSIIALFGGTFNPPHLGHANTLQQLHKAIGFEKVKLIPNEIQPHRQKTQVSANHRLAMLELVAAQLNRRQNEQGLPAVYDVSDYEIVQAQSHHKVSYSVDTVEYFSAMLSAQQKLVFVIGEDSYHNFTTWHQWQTILQSASLLVMKRGGSYEHDSDRKNTAKLASYHRPLDHLKDSESHGIYFANNDEVAVSSTEIRQLLLKAYQKNEIAKPNKALSSLLNTEVLNYICEHRLYNEDKAPSAAS